MELMVFSSYEMFAVIINEPVLIARLLFITGFLATGDSLEDRNLSLWNLDFPFNVYEDLTHPRQRVIFSAADSKIVFRCTWI